MIIQQLVVVADAHLCARSPADEKAFVAWLDTVPGRGDALLLAGDIYDFWYTYRHLIPRECIRTTAAIIELARRMPVFMLGGNHDRWGDSFWSRQTDVQFSRRHRLQVAERQVLALHGDGLHEERSVAAILNHVLDAAWVQSLFDMLPPALGFAIAHRLAHDPSQMALRPDILETAAARQLAWATNAFAQDPAVDTLIMGHTHKVALQEIGAGHWYLNPGPWLGERRFATVTGSGIDLQVFG